MDKTTKAPNTERRRDGTFAKGSTGNRKGRPPESKNRHTIIREVLTELVPAQIGGRKTKIPTSEATIRVLLKKAIEGDLPSIKQVIELWAKTDEEAQKSREPDYPFTDVDLKIISEIHDRMKAYLSNGEDLSEGEGHLVLTLPVRARFRGGRVGLLYPKGEAVRSAGPDAALIKAIAKAHRWKEMLLSGEVASVEALAAKLKQERRHVGRTLGLSFLSPDITRSILRGEQPGGLRLAHLLNADIPLSWREQGQFIERLATLGS